MNSSNYEFSMIIIKFDFKKNLQKKEEDNI